MASLQLTLELVECSPEPRNRGELLVPRRDDEQQCRVARPASQKAELAGRQLVGPVQVLEQEHQGTVTAASGVEGLEAIDHGGWLPLARVHLGEACLLADRREEASVEATRALTLARERGEHAYETYALWLSGELAAERRDEETAGQRYREARTLAGQLGMRPLAARRQLGLGRTHRLSGRRDDARSELAHAREAFDAMAMSYWLARADVELAALG